MEVLDLKLHPEFIDQYITLRNSYCELLLTHPVTYVQTKEWLKNAQAYVAILIDNKKLLGVSILYFARSGEVAIFIAHPGKGYGTILLEKIEKIAKENHMPYIWSWTLKENMAAQKLFTKNKFTRKGIVKRIYNNETKTGVEFSKTLQ